MLVLCQASREKRIVSKKCEVICWDVSIVMPLPPDTVSENIMFSGCLSVAFICLFVRSSGQILLPRYLMNATTNFDKTDREYSLASTDDLVRFWRSKS